MELMITGMVPKQTFMDVGSKLEVFSCPTIGVDVLVADCGDVGEDSHCGVLGQLLLPGNEHMLVGTDVGFGFVLDNMASLIVVLLRVVEDFVEVVRVVLHKQKVLVLKLGNLPSWHRHLAGTFGRREPSLWHALVERLQRAHQSCRRGRTCWLS